MPLAHLFLLAVLLSAGPGSANEQHAAENEAVDTRSLKQQSHGGGSFGGLAKAMAGVANASTAATNGSIEGAAEVTAGAAAEKAAAATNASKAAGKDAPSDTADATADATAAANAGTGAAKATAGAAAEAAAAATSAGKAADKDAAASAADATAAGSDAQAEDGAAGAGSTDADAAEADTAASQGTASELYSIDDAKAFAAMAKLTYCGPGPVPLAPYGSHATMPSLVPASCGEFCERAGFELEKTLLVARPAFGQKNAEFAYVSKIAPVKAGGRTPADCAIAFRGTWVTPANMNTDDNITLVDFTSPSCESGCQVVGGPYLLWQDLQGGIAKSLGELGCSKGATVAVTGHSLGGVVASIAMFFLQDQLGYDVALSYTFEQTKPFNKKATETFETLFPHRAVSYFRITNTNDQVTRYPASSELYHPGYQVWYTSVEDDAAYTLCGTQLDAPDCGTLGIPKDRLCLMMEGNPPELGCGGYAPYNGPHCRMALAPAQSMCDFAGNSKSLFISASVATCMAGRPMQDKASGPTELPPVFPPKDLPEEAPAEVPAPTPAPTPAPMDLHQAVVESSKGEDCFKSDTASSPLSMFGHYVQTVDSAQACQKRCAETAYCEMFTYNSYESAGGEGGGCELTGGWGQYVPGILGSLAGPKDCSKTPPELSDSQKFELFQEYMRFIGEQYDGHYALQYERREGGMGLAEPRGFSLASTACIGAAMLLVGASAMLLVARTGRLAGALGLAAAGPSASASRLLWAAAADERGLAWPEE